jgi:hypothetical protein
VPPFCLRFILKRQQRVAEVFPWLPALAGSLGFSIGAAFLAIAVSPWFLLFLLLPVIFYRGLFALLLELVFYPSKPVEVIVDGDELTVQTGSERRMLPLDGIIQVFRAGEVWTVLHIDGTVLHIPAGVATEKQIEFLKSFALRAAEERKRNAE